MNQVTISEERYDELKAAERILKDTKEYQRLKERIEAVEKKHLSQSKGECEVKYSTIGEDAKTLNVTRNHLWCVLEGRRKSASLMKRYNALKSKQKGAQS